MNKKIKPMFNKDMPKTAGYFFNPASDDAFRRKHPIGYNVLVACGITALLLPMFLYLVFTLGIYPAPNSGWLVLGMAGSFIIGIAFFNLVAAWIGQYLGHLVTALCMVIGSLLVGVSVLLLYNKTLYNQFDEEMVSYYFINMFLLCLPVIYYVLFRFSMDCWLQKRGIHISAIRKKGIMNHLWYQEYKEKCGVGLLYIINLVFTIAFPAAFLLHLLLGWIKIISIPVSGLLVISCVLTTLMSLFSCIQNNMRVHGHPFVLVAKSENDGIDSFLLDLGAAALPLGVAYAELLTVINLMHVG